MSNIKKSLKIALADSEINIGQISGKCGISRGAIYASFYNRKNPTLKTIEKVASCFGMTASEFIALGEER